MILLLGATSYSGQAFASELRRRGGCFVPLTRKALDYTRFEVLFDYVRKLKPEFILNAAEVSSGFTEETSEFSREETLQTNAVLPQTIARVCLMTNTPFGHVSSGSIYSGAKVFQNGRMQIERDLRPELFDQHPENFLGFTELDEPNFSFRHQPCSSFSGTKALAEESVRENHQAYIWRLRLPFNERDEPGNWLAQLQRSLRISDTVNSLSHLEDCVRACLDLWERHAPFGTYNVTNPGAVTTRHVLELIKRILKTGYLIDRWMDEPGFRNDDKTPESNCVLDVSKLLGAGIRIRNVEEALEKSLRRWQSVPVAHPRAALPTHYSFQPVVV